MIDSNSIKRGFSYINEFASEMAEPSVQLATKLISKLFSWNGSKTATFAYGLGTGILTALFPCIRQRLVNSLPSPFSASYAYIPPNGSIQKKVDDICKELGIRQVQVLVYNNPDMPCNALGTCLGAAGKPILYVDRNALRDFEDTEFLVRHELAHIARNDSLFKVLIHNGTLFCTSLLYDRVLGVPQSCGALLIKGAICDLLASSLSLLYSRHAEQHADQAAVLSASHNRSEIAQQGMQFFEDLRYGNQYFRQLEGSWGALLMTEEGENRWDLEHPSLTYRIERLEPYRAS